MTEKTDLQKFIDLYASFGIELKPENQKSEDGEDVLEILMYEMDHDKFEGYSCFFSAVVFDLDGKFIKQGFWE